MLKNSRKTLIGILKEIPFKLLNMHFVQLCCILFNFVLIIKAKLL